MHGSSYAFSFDSITPFHSTSLHFIACNRFIRSCAAPALCPGSKEHFADGISSGQSHFFCTIASGNINAIVGGNSKEISNNKKNSYEKVTTIYF
jgi:hypothetical protein